MDNFLIALGYTLQEEGGYSNNPKDPGGSTYKGVTQRTYDDYRHSKNLPYQDVRLIKTAELNELYKDRYWMLANGDNLPTGVDVQVFDMAVNAGWREAGKCLQRACNILQPAAKLVVDGAVGPSTVAVANSINTLSLINEYANQRLIAYASFADAKTFLAGWTARTGRVKSKAITLYTGALVAGQDVVRKPREPLFASAGSEPRQGGVVAFFRAAWERWFG